MSTRIFTCDFETTVYENQKHTEVWASAIVELFTENVIIVNSLPETIDYFISLNENVIWYYHNLKFDGSFWLDFLLIQKGFKQACLEYDDYFEWLPNKEMGNNTFKYNISSMGQFYTITIKVNNHFIEIRDSLKLLPFSVKKIGKDFKTKHQKLEMEYEGYRYAGCEIKPEEKRYIRNDVLVMNEALAIMVEEGHSKLTIGACCLSEYKNICKNSLKNQLSYEEMFPDLYEYYHTKDETVDAWIRKSYKGGWCYLVPEKANKIYHNGLTADVNSLYPSMMSSESGNYYPIGEPHHWDGNYIPEIAFKGNKYYFIHIKTKFDLKEGYLPFIQIKKSLLYKGTECLKTSKIFDPESNNYVNEVVINGEVYTSRVDLYLTMTDFELLKEHYNLTEFEIIDGYWFYSEIGIFDEYIDKYKKKKIESEGAKRLLAKLFLNNLYGKFAASKESYLKIAYVKPEGVIGFRVVKSQDKKPGYIAVGSAITSYARNFTIRTAQKNFHGVDKPGFIYADTDSIHCDLNHNELVDVKTHKVNFCKWSLESYWDKAIFVRQKTYIEHVTHSDEKEVQPFNCIKCAGMPEACKKLLNYSLTDTEPTQEELAKMNEEKIRFLYDADGNFIKRDLTDFRIKLKVPGKLLPKRIPGGIILKETNYEMRG